MSLRSHIARFTLLLAAGTLALFSLSSMAAEPERHASGISPRIDKVRTKIPSRVESKNRIPVVSPDLAESQAVMHWHPVLPGETLEGIAKHYGAGVDRILKWNELTEPEIKVQDWLKLFVKKPVRQRSLVNYWIRRGDTLESIAVRFEMTPEQILGLNGKRARVLRPRNSLKIYAYRGSVVSVPLGKPTQGRLYNGEQMPPGNGYIIRNPKESYGTTRTLNHLASIVKEVRRKDWGMPPVVIGDISLKRGGFIKPHKSHQNGMDVDVGYVPKDPRYTGRYFTVNESRLDIARSFNLIKAFVDTGEVEYIFVSYWVQRMLYRHARKYLSKDELKTLFQYPRHRSVRVGMIRDSKGHHDHFHVRFRSTDQRVAQGSSRP